MVVFFFSSNFMQDLDISLFFSSNQCRQYWQPLLEITLGAFFMNKNPLLETDQTRCFDERGNEINCNDTGQDAAFNSGRPSAHNRFNVAGKIVQDRWTGLLWSKHANLPDFPLNWEEAFEFIENINKSEKLESYHWRLPARSDLFSLISHQYINPALPAFHPFDNVFNGYYWTRTECARLPDQVWYVHLGGGKVFRGMKHGAYLVWPVAGLTIEGHSGEDRFNVDENLLFDRVTQKVWYLGEELKNGPLTWNAAIDKIKELNEKKITPYNDWRLPNIRELESLTDTTMHSPALARGCSLTNVQDGYWSSTTSVYEPSYAWVLYTRDGAVGVGYKPQSEFFTLAVR
jgi:hypothetical protein